MHSGCFPVDSDGFIVNTASVDKIQPVFRSLVGDIIKGVSNRLQSDLLTLFLRGSVSSGRAFLGTSDLDIVVVTKSVPTTDVLDWNKTFAETLQSQMPVVSLIDLRLIQHQVLLEDRSYARLRVYLSTESVLLAGENLQLPKFKPNRELALYMHSDLEREIIGNYSGGYLRGGDEGITRESVRNRAHHIETLFAGGGQEAADSTENLSARKSAE